jgi:hypothetical protein
MQNPGEEIGGHKDTSLLIADGLRERGAEERRKAKGTKDEIHPSSF